MKFYYKCICLFILHVLFLNLAFGQRLAVGPYFSYDLINKDYFDKAFGFTGGAIFFLESKNSFSFKTGFLFSIKYYKSTYAFHPYLNKQLKPPYILSYESTKIYKSFILPVALSFKFLNTYNYSIYCAVGLSLQFRYNDYGYGTGYKVLDTNLTIDKGPFDFEYTNIPTDENKFKFKNIDVEFAVGGEYILSEYIKTGIEFKKTIPVLITPGLKNSFSIAIFGKYYFEETKRHKRKNIK